MARTRAAAAGSAGIAPPAKPKAPPKKPMAKKSSNPARKATGKEGDQQSKAPPITLGAKGGLFADVDIDAELAREASDPDHGPVIPPFNGRKIPPAHPRAAANAIAPTSNPFYQTMPAPEIWHRHMPAAFPFGETPFMEKQMTRQITADLLGGTEKADDIDTAAAAADEMAGPSTTTEPASAATPLLEAGPRPIKGFRRRVDPIKPAYAPVRPEGEPTVYPPQWALPEIPDNAVEESLMQQKTKGNAPTEAASAGGNRGRGQKRKRGET